MAIDVRDEEIRAWEAAARFARRPSLALGFECALWVEFPEAVVNAMCKR